MRLPVPTMLSTVAPITRLFLTLTNADNYNLRLVWLIRSSSWFFSSASRLRCIRTPNVRNVRYRMDTHVRRLKAFIYGISYIRRLAYAYKSYFCPLNETNTSHSLYHECVRVSEHLVHVDNDPQPCGSQSLKTNILLCVHGAVCIFYDAIRYSKRERNWKSKVRTRGISIQYT